MGRYLFTNCLLQGSIYGFDCNSSVTSDPNLDGQIERMVVQRCVAFLGVGAADGRSDNTGYLTAGIMCKSMTVRDCFVTGRAKSAIGMSGAGVTASGLLRAYRNRFYLTQATDKALNLEGLANTLFVDNVIWSTSSAGFFAVNNLGHYVEGNNLYFPTSLVAGTLKEFAVGAVNTWTRKTKAEAIAEGLIGSTNTSTRPTWTDPVNGDFSSSSGVAAGRLLVRLNDLPS